MNKSAFALGNGLGLIVLVLIALTSVGCGTRTGRSAEPVSGDTVQPPKCVVVTETEIGWSSTVRRADIYCLKDK